MICISLSCFGNCFCLFIIFIICLILFIVIIFNSQILFSSYALVFPESRLCVSVLSEPEHAQSVSSHSSVISGFLAFSEFFLRSSFSWFPALFLIYIVMNSPVLCSS